MGPKEHIQELYLRKAKNDDNSDSLTKLLMSTIETSLQGGQKFIFELLQNADDASFNGNEVAVSFNYISTSQANYLVFSHTGRHFEHADVEKICAIAHTNDKAQDIQKTGYKGIGFKAIFSVAERVQIISDGYKFCFDKNYQHSNSTKGEYPWPIIPIWTGNSVPTEIKSHLTESEVVFILTLKPNIDIKSDLKFIITQPEIALFLRHVKNIKLAINGKEETIQIRNNGELKELIYNQAFHSQWLLQTYRLQIPTAIQDVLKGMSDKQCPERLKKATETRITFAARVNAAYQIEKTTHARLYAYLPTQVNHFGLPYLVNADFLLDLSRAQLIDSLWNEFLLEKIGFLQLRWLAKLGEIPAYRRQILVLLDYHMPHSAPFQRGYREGSQEISFIPAADDEAGLLKVSEAVDDQTLLHHQLELQPGDGALIDPLLQKREILKKLHVRTITINSLLKEIRYIANLDKSLSFQAKLLKNLWSLVESQNSYKDHYTLLLRQETFILNQYGTFNKPDEIYFPADSTFAQLGIVIPFAHPELSDECREELSAMGVKELKQVNLIRDHIIQKNFNCITKQNVISLTQLIFTTYLAKEFSETDFQQLKKMPVLTQAGHLVPVADTYLADCYDPPVKLATYLSPERVLAESYLSDKSQAKQWQKFFCSLGAQANIRFDCKTYPLGNYDSDRKKPYLNEYLATQQFNAVQGNTSLQNFIDCNVYELFQRSDWLHDQQCINAFWQRLLSFLHSTSSYVPIEYVYRSNKHRRIETLKTSYLAFILDKISCVPASDGHLHKVSEIYAPQFKKFSSLLTPILSRELTLEDVDYLGFKTQLSLEDCLDQLNRLASATAFTLALYVEIIQQLLKLTLSAKDLTKLQTWTGKLPAQNRAWMEKSQLQFFAFDRQLVSANSNHWLHDVKELPLTDMQKLCQWFAIPIINAENAEFQTEGAQEDESAIQVLRRILPALARIEAHATCQDEQQIIQQLWEKLSRLKCYSVQDLWYAPKHAAEIKLTIATHLNDNTVFYKRAWNHNRTIDQFCQQISSYFELDQKSASLLRSLLGEQDSLAEWLEGNNYPSDNLLPLPSASEMPATVEHSATAYPAETLGEASAADEEEFSQPLTSAAEKGLLLNNSTGIPRLNSPAAHYAIPMRQEREVSPSMMAHSQIQDIAISRVSLQKVPFSLPMEQKSAQVAETSRMPYLKQNSSTMLAAVLQGPSNQHERSRNQRNATERDTQEIGRWGEHLVYTKLQAHYQAKYPECSLQETENGFILQKEGQAILQVTWHNKNGESGASIDIETYKPIKETAKQKRYIEVKSTISQSDAVVNISASEYTVMKQLRSRYHFFRVYGALSRCPRVEKIKNPAERLEQGEITVAGMQLKLPKA